MIWGDVMSFCRELSNVCGLSSCIEHSFLCLDSNKNFIEDFSTIFTFFVAFAFFHSSIWIVYCRHCLKASHHCLKITYISSVDSRFFLFVKNHFLQKHIFLMRQRKVVIPYNFSFALLQFSYDICDIFLIIFSYFHPLMPSTLIYIHCATTYMHSTTWYCFLKFKEYISFPVRIVFPFLLSVPITWNFLHPFFWYTPLTLKPCTYI